MFTKHTYNFLYWTKTTYRLVPKRIIAHPKAFIS